MSRMLLSLVLAIPFVALAETETDPAPSGNEQGHVYTDAKGETSVETPGKDYPVTSEREGNKEKIDFGSDYDPEKVHEDDVTIEREKPESQRP